MSDNKTSPPPPRRNRKRHEAGRVRPRSERKRRGMAETAETAPESKGRNPSESRSAPDHILRLHEKIRAEIPSLPLFIILYIDLRFQRIL